MKPKDETERNDRLLKAKNGSMFGHRTNNLASCTARVFDPVTYIVAILALMILLFAGESARAQVLCLGEFQHKSTCYPDLASAERAMRSTAGYYYLQFKEQEGNRRTYDLPPRPPLPPIAWRSAVPYDYVWGYWYNQSPVFATAAEALAWAQTEALFPTPYSPNDIVSDDLVFRGSYNDTVGSQTYERKIYSHNYTNVPVTTVEMPLVGGAHFGGTDGTPFTHGIPDAKISQTFHTIHRHENTPDPTVYHVKGGGVLVNGELYVFEALPTIPVSEVDSAPCQTPYSFDGTECVSDYEDQILDFTQGPFYSATPPEQDSLTCNDTNPCNPADGTKTQIEPDYASAGSGGLVFNRHYRSQGTYKTGSGMGAGWRHTYSRTLDEEPDRKPTLTFAAPVDHQSPFYSTPTEACTAGWDDIKDTVWAGSIATATATYSGGNQCKLTSGGSTVAYLPVRSLTGWTGQPPSATVKTIIRPNGGSYRFEQVGGIWTNTFNPSLKLAQSGSNWIFTDADDTEETYNSSGQLIEIARRNGQTETLEYTLTAAQGGDDDPSTLDRVTGPFGHSLSFSYDSNGKLASVSTPDGVVQYTYGTNDNLTEVTYPDTKTRRYQYDGWDLPNHLAGIYDEDNYLYVNWEYDDVGRAVTSQHYNYQDRIELVYNTDGTTTLKLFNGAERTYTFTNEQGERRLASLTGDVCATCPGGDIKLRDYDSNGFLSEVTDWNDNVTKMTRNHRGLVETLVEGFGSTEERTTSTAWHSTFRLPTQVTSPQNVTDYTFDSNGNVLTATVSGGGNTRSWTFTYNAEGQPLTIDGPRTDVTDLTTLEYYNCSTGNECGQLKKVTNALGQITTYDMYDGAGRLTQMTSANGLVTSYAYDTRGRMTTITETPTAGTARVTSMTYTGYGKIKTYTFPSGTTLTYTYDRSQYLTHVIDNLGNYIRYSYDVMGNLASEDTYDAQNSLKQNLDYVHDKNYHLDSMTHGPVATDVTFDLVGNLTEERDGNNELTQHAFDALNRLDMTTDALSGVTDYSYDDHDNVTQVLAPNGATTTFAYDQLDNLLSETSPDRGVVTYTYDDAGNRLTETDARNITGTYAYDALNRPISITYPNTAENVTFTYDHAPTKGIGRLRSISDQSGTTTWSYNEFGQVLSDQRVIGSVTYTTSYQYDGGGNLLSMTYPGGRTVSYARNALGQVTSVTSDQGGTQKSIVSSAAYEPFGPMSSATYGNGMPFDYSRRTDYRIDGYTSGIAVDKDYSYDGNGNILSITDVVNSNYDSTFAYDSLNRVTQNSIRLLGGSGSYESIVLATNPILYWRLGESSGPTANDASGNGHHGTYSGTMVPGQPALISGSDTSTQFNTNQGHIGSPALTGAAINGFDA